MAAPGYNNIFQQKKNLHKRQRKIQIYTKRNLPWADAIYFCVGGNPYVLYGKEEKKNCRSAQHSFTHTQTHTYTSKNVEVSSQFVVISIN